MAKDDIYETTVRQTFAGQNIVNVHHFLQSRVDGSGKAEDALDFLWNNIFKQAHLEICTGDLTIVDISIRRIKPTQTQPTVYPVGAAGLIMSNTLPPQCTVLVRQFAEPAGRKGTGSVKICALPGDEIFEGRVSESYLTLLNTYGSKFLGEVVLPSAYAFYSAVYSQIDKVARPILKGVGSARVRTVHSRQIGVGI